MTSRSFLAAAILALAPQPSLAIMPVTLKADLYLDFECKVPPRETAMEGFLAGERFAIQRGAERRPETQIDLKGYDARRWTIAATGPVPLSQALRLYTLSVQSPPPTVHDTALEGRIVAFVEQKLGCTVTYQSRGENPESMRKYFDLAFAMALKEDAYEVCKPASPAYDTARCAAMPQP